MSTLPRRIQTDIIPDRSGGVYVRFIVWEIDGTASSIMDIVELTVIQEYLTNQGKFESEGRRLSRYIESHFEHVVEIVGSEELGGRIKNTSSKLGRIAWNTYQQKLKAMAEEV